VGAGSGDEVGAWIDIVVSETAGAGEGVGSTKGCGLASGLGV
jgi:hypothetical protein